MLNCRNAFGKWNVRWFCRCLCDNSEIFCFHSNRSHLSLWPLIITDKEFAIVFIACILYFITSENLLISSYIIYFVRNNLEENQISKREKRKTTVHTEHFECKNWKPDLKNDQNRKTEWLHVHFCKIWVSFSIFTFHLELQNVYILLRKKGKTSSKVTFEHH